MRQAMTVEGEAAQNTARSQWASLGVKALVLAWLCGCSSPEPIELVAVRGCGLDQEFSGLRVRVLGDFPASGGGELLLGPTERGSIPELPDRATGIAAEGLFGTTVTAIGRSYGIDPTLARGRIPGLDPDAPILPVFFAPPDHLCELDSQPSPRTELAGAAGPAGDVLFAGGIDGDGVLLDELVHVDVFSNAARVLGARLPSARRGASVHAIDHRRFVVVGGAGPGGALAERIEVDVSGQGSVGSTAALTLEGESFALAHHGWANGGLDGRVLIVGGCKQADDSGACVAASARAQSFWFDPRDPANTELLPELETPRFAAHVALSSDGVGFVAGGFGADGLGLGSVERLEPGGEWSTVHSLDDDQATIAGLTLLDGGLVLLSEPDGTIHWWSEVGSGILDPTARAPALAPLAPGSSARPLLTLPGERVLVDTWLFAPATAAVDPAAERVALDLLTPNGPPARHGATALMLADGTVMIAGGRLTAAPFDVAQPTLLRLRPQLDGPDEWIPDLAGPQTDAFVSNAPGRATVVLGGLRIDANGGPVDALAPVRAHVRGFRSLQMRLEFEFSHDPGASAQVVLTQGAATVVSVALLPDEVVVRRRDANGVVETLDCAQAGVEPGKSVILEVRGASGGGSVELRLSSEELLASCMLEWPSTAGLAVGFGASGTGAARFFGLRLARR